MLLHCHKVSENLYVLIVLCSTRYRINSKYRRSKCSLTRVCTVFCLVSNTTSDDQMDIANFRFCAGKGFNVANYTLRNGTTSGRMLKRNAENLEVQT